VMSACMAESVMSANLGWGAGLSSGQGATSARMEVPLYRTGAG